MATLRAIIQTIRHWIRMFFRTRDWRTFCLFIVFTIMIWFGHAMNSTRERVLEIPISYTGIPEETVFDQELPTQLHIHVRDQGKRLRTYSKVMSAPLTIDLSKQIDAEEGNIIISSEYIRPAITDHLQGTAKLQKISPDVIQSSYTKQSSKTVPVVFQGELRPAEQYQFSVAPALSPMFVKVYGSATALSQTDTIWTQYYKQYGIHDTLSTMLLLELPSYLRTTNNKVQLTAIAEAYTEKVLTLPIITQGVPEGLKLITFPSVVQLTVRVGIQHFKEVTADKFQAVCHFPNRETDKLPVHIKHTSQPTHISHMRISPSEVEYIIEKQ